MKTLILFAVFLSSSAFAASKLEIAVRDLTHEAILVRAGLAKCKVDPGLTSFAGAQLEQSYDGALAGLSDSDMTVVAWRKLTKRSCIRDCSCSALSKLHEKYPEKAKKKISTRQIESTLSKMTDASYRKCMERLPKFCDLPKVKEFIQVLSQNQPIADDAP